MKICVQCVLNDSFPGIRFDSAGICNFCRSFENVKDNSSDTRTAALRQFEKLVKEYSSRRPYQVLMCWSGGKDSTYTLYALVKKFKLRVLAYTVDNGFLAQETHTNLKKVARSLGVDHILFQPDFSIMKRMFNKSLNKNAFAAVAAERSSQACASCIGLVKYSAFRTAMDKKIPMIAFGWSPGQNSLSTGTFRLSRPMYEEMKNTYVQNMKKIDVAVSSDYINEKNPKAAVPYLVHPSSFLNYDEKEIYSVIKKLGWIKPKKLDANSTNCKMNSLAVLQHTKQYGFNPYSSELARLVRGGYLSRSAALKRLNGKLDPGTLNEVRQKLGLKEAA